jgi:hypothetical protein
MNARTPHSFVVQTLEGRDSPGFYDCAACPLSQFGSAHQGGTEAGQACKQRVRLLVLPEGWGQPAILSLPTMSVRPWNTFCSSLIAQFRRPFYGFKIAFDLVKQENKTGQPYSVVQPRVHENVTDPDTARAILALQTDFRRYVRDTGVQVDFEDAVEV